MEAAEISHADPRPRCPYDPTIRCGSQIGTTNAEGKWVCRDPVCRKMTAASAGEAKTPRKTRSNSLIFSVTIRLDPVPKPPERCFGRFTRGSEWCSTCLNATRCREAASPRAIVAEISPAAVKE